jgi:integrase/recombinase XerC
MTYNALTVWKPQAKVFSHFSDAEAAAIIDKADGPKYRYFFMTLLGTGLRIGEVLHIRVKDLIDGMDGFTLIITREKKGAGVKPERLPIAQELGKRLKDYCHAAKLQPNDLIFDGHPNSYRYALRMAAKAAGLSDWQHVHPHQFRHSFIYSKVSQGIHPLILTRLVGHSSLQVTQQYYAPTENDLRKAMENK